MAYEGKGKMRGNLSFVECRKRVQKTKFMNNIILTGDITFGIYPFACSIFKSDLAAERTPQVHHIPFVLGLV